MFFSKSCKVLLVLFVVCLPTTLHWSFFFSVIFFLCVLFFFLAVTEHKGPAAPLHTDASIVYREEEEEEGPHQTRPTPITSCLDPQPHPRDSRLSRHRRSSSRMDSSVKNVHLYINNILLCNSFVLFVSVSWRCSWRPFLVLFFGDFFQPNGKKKVKWLYSKCMTVAFSDVRHCCL